MNDIRHDTFVTHDGLAKPVSMVFGSAWDLLTKLGGESDDEQACG